MEGQVQNIAASSQTRAPVSIIQQVGVPQGTGVKVPAVKLLVTIELVIGLLTVVFGVGLFIHGMITAAYAIIGGFIICGTGCVGVSSIQDPKNYCKNRVHMGFSILACCVSAFGIGIYSFFQSFDYFVETGRIFTVLLMVISTLEFITALSAAIFTCHFACCNGRSCCGDCQKGIVMHHGNQPYVITNTNGDTLMMTPYPLASLPQNFPSTNDCQNQVFSTIPFNTTSANLTHNTTLAVQSGLSITYSNQGPPPAYQVNKEVVERS